MNREQAQEIITLLQGIKWSEDGEIALNLQFRDISEWLSAPYPNFNFDECEYRLKPEPKYVPFTYEDDLVGMKVKSKIGTTEMMIILKNNDGVANRNAFYTYSELFENFVQSENGLPCGKEVRG